MTLHSSLPPSSAARRVACPGSRALEKLFPEEQESQEAREGTAAHWVANEMLCNEPTRPDPAIGFITPNGESVTQEMIDGGQLYVNTVMETVTLVKFFEALEAPDQTIYKCGIEEKIDISNVHPECWGTPDFWFFDPKINKLTVIDYKFGHRFVEVYENWQLIEYAAGILKHLGINGELDQRVVVEFHVVQPRHYGPENKVRRWVVNACDLRGYFNVLSAAEYASFLPDAKTIPSEECIDCSAKHACAALQKTACNILDVSKSNTPSVLDNHQIGHALKQIRQAIKRLEALELGLSEQAIALLKNGINVPYFTVEHGTGRDRWINPVDEIIALGELFGLDLRKPVEAVTPKQAIDKGVPKDVIKPYYETPKGAAKLVEIKDARKAFNT